MDISLGGTLDTELTNMWLLVCAFNVFFMQVRPAAAPLPAAAPRGGRRCVCLH